MILKLDKKLHLNKDAIESPNLTDRFSDEDLSRIGERIWTGYSVDRQSRANWMRRNNAGMNLAMQIAKDKSYPWPNCSNIIFPLITIAAVNFSTKSYGNLVQGVDVVQYRTFGTDENEKARAIRIGKHMSWQVLEEDKGWEDQHDKLLINLAVVGTNFIKTRMDASLGHNVAELVMAKDLVINYWAASVEKALRRTHIIPLTRNDIYERVQEKTYANCLEEAWYNSLPVLATDEGAEADNRSGLTPPPPDEDTPFRGLEQHCRLDLDGDGYAEPYIVTIEEGSQKVLKIACRFEREEAIERVRDSSTGKVQRIHATEYFTKYTFIPSPDGGIYDVGFGYLLGPLNEGVNTAINQIFDAGTMANSNGGFLGRGAKIRGGVYTFAPWEWKRVDSTGDDLRKSLVQLPTREPSSVLLSVLQFLVNYADRLAGTVEQSTGQTPGQNTPAETSRNALEQGLEIYGMIFKRVWRSMKGEFKLLHKLNAQFLPNKKRYGTGTGGVVLREDYLSNPDNLAPVADPNIVSSSMRIGQAQAMREAAHSVPGYAIQEVEKNFLRALRVDNIETYYPGPDKVPPLPNPKMQVEQMKMEVKKLDLQRKQQESILKLKQQQSLNDAQIMLLRAQSAEIISGIQLAKQAHALEVFNSAIEALEKHNEALNQNIETLQKLTGDGDENSSDGGGVPKLAGGPGNGGTPGAAGPMGGGTQGAMG